jgi:hypothetical protein
MEVLQEEGSMKVNPPASYLLRLLTQPNTLT